MKWTIAASLLTVVAALRIETPASLITCQPAAITFGDGQPPYFIAVLPAGEVSAAPIQQFAEQQTSPYTWNVNLAAGTNITLRVTDSSGNPAYSSPAVVQAGPDTSCIGSGSSASASASGGSASASGSSGASATSANPSASSAAQSATQSGAAVGNHVGGPVVGVLGLVAAALGVYM